MFNILGKKKLTIDALANIFVNSVLDAIDNGFEDVAAIINNAAEFISQPEIVADDDSKFTLIVLAANLKEVPKYFEAKKDNRLISVITEKLSKVFEIDKFQLDKNLNDYKSYLSRVNHPSKNNIYAMSKAVFFKYELGQYQEEYFKNLNAPNPLLLKRLDKAMEMFLFDWERYKKDYQIIDH